MNLQGTIKSITPDGGYQGTNGYIHTYQMTIEAANGAHTGQIGSKSQPYPLGAGSPIAVEVSETPHGVRFKKFNPQYGQQQAPQNQQAPPNSNGEKEERIMRGNSLNAIMSATDVPLDMVGDYLLAGVRFIKTGKWSITAAYAQQEPSDDIPY